ncbi:hypothetical protein GOQ27_07250 [Clostridium sp. D2Q-11]|uniref:Lipoprotein n=1 Tax=Anaeromonas frigoriresistens TaxID=2683708 RepID=A0A942Z8Q7_9FIRM|nr:hypothetical protein [Anaeromonas frigoriresistens]MBS4538254.1 hypothetical protein [Anaeromonas frigoriresistens]
MFKKVLVLIAILSLLLMGCDDLDSTNSQTTDSDDDEIYTIDLLELSEEEMGIYDEFKKNYDESELKGVEPLSICKMYLHAGYNKDYETQYELYIKDEEYVQWSKEEDMEFPEKDRMKSYEEFQSVENLKVDITEQKHANINWDHPEEVDSDGKPYRFGFNLVKNKDGIWKVHFMPLQ